MKIGMMVYSETNHTWEVAKEMEEGLLESGHEVSIERITATGKTMMKTLTYAPDPNGYDVVLFCSPVQGFGLPQVMRNYLDQIAWRTVRRYGIVLTQHFKWSGLGGLQAARQIKKRLTFLDAELVGRTIIHWSSRKRSEQIIAAKSFFVELANK